MKLINTNEYLLLIDEEAEIKENELGWGGGDIIEFFRLRWMEKDWKKIVAYYPLTKEVKELDLPLLPNPFKVNIESIVKKLLNVPEEHLDGEDWNKIEFGIKCYKAAQYDKKYSLDDIANAYSVGQLYGEQFIQNTIGRLSNYDFTALDKEDYIQSLSTQQLPKEFIPEYDSKCWCTKPMREGCWECIKILKTITNSEGKQEIQGRYIYE